MVDPSFTKVSRCCVGLKPRQEVVEALATMPKAAPMDHGDCFSSKHHLSI